ncbi:hypothetical protein [Lentzea sp. HUAS12]|uniref:hypothetical protein n=1 Tax=Lentzea sp. HUAS12 TaxID=2951806 RepID=UPI00209E8761|nr:hypothetical protein [Lentzea sp. HUAS12]USX49378.1 hypothetical protein ND450_28535 [Lentzea sp. HUAS12]
MSHREEPRSGRGCFGAVVVVPFLALGGMFALIAFTGGAAEKPLAAPPSSVRPTASWWTEPFETGVSLATVTETVVAEGAAREVRAARMATQTRVVGGATVTETVRVSSTKPAAVERNEPSAPEESVPAASEPETPVVTTTSVVVSTVESSPPPLVETPVVTPPPSVEVPPSTPRAEDPVVPVTTPAEPPCDRSEPGPGGETQIPVVPAEVPDASGSSSAGE